MSIVRGDSSYPADTGFKMRPLDDTWVNGIKVCRERAGLSQEELARRVGTNRQQIQRLEAGGRKLTIEWAARIARVRSRRHNPSREGGYG